MYVCEHSLEVGRRVWSSTRVMILLEVGLERSVAVCGAAGLLISKSRTRAGHQIIVVFSDAILTAPDSPAHDGNTTKKDSTTNAANDSADDFLVAVAETTVAVA